MHASNSHNITMYKYCTLGFRGTNRNVHHKKCYRYCILKRVFVALVDNTLISSVQVCEVYVKQHDKETFYNIHKLYAQNILNISLLKTPVSSYDGVTSVCSCSFISEARTLFAYVNDGRDAA